MKRHNLLVLCLCFAATGAIAQDGNGPGQGQQPDTRQGLTFADFKIACQNPARFHNQIAPSNIQVTCRDQIVKWVPDDKGAGSYPLATQHSVMTSVASDKYSSKPELAKIDSAPQMQSCPTLREVVETIDTVRAVSCQELIAFTGTSADFCAAAALTIKSQNPSAKQEEDSGRTINFCTSPSVQGEGKNL